MKFKRIDLLTLLISLFILGGCKNPDGIGLAIDPSKALQTNLMDTVTINAVTALDDSVETSQGDAAVGIFNDPVFGKTEANLAASISLPGSSAFTRPITGTITVDSAVLVLAYAHGFYGDQNMSYNLTVNQLAEPVLSSKAYYNTKAWASNQSVLLKSVSFVAHPTDSLNNIIDIVTGGPDTVKKLGPQLRVKLDPAFINKYFINATATTLGNNSVFQNNILGLYISINTTTTSSTTPGTKHGGIMFFDMTTGNSKVDVYYHYTDANAAIDTVVTSLPLGTPHAVQIKYGYNSNPSIVTQTHNTSQNASYNTLYLQALSGLRGRISFPYLKNIFNTLGGDISVNRAELVITPDTSSAINTAFAPTPRLGLYRYDIAHQRIVLPDASSSDPHYYSIGTFGGFYDSYPTRKSYHFVITGYIDDLMRGKVVDYGTFIMPSDTTGLSTGNVTLTTSSSAQIANRVVIGGGNGKNTLSPSQFKMKLNILYNKVIKQ